MQHELRFYLPDDGWSAPLPEHLDSEDTLVLVFAAPDYADRTAPFEELRAAFPKAQFLGCSTSGEIHGNRVLDHAISVAIARFEHTKLACAKAQVRGAQQSYAVGRELATSLNRPGLCSVMLLSDGLSVNGSELVRGLNSALGKEVVVTGGLAGDGAEFRETFVLDGCTPRTGLVSAIGFYGSRVRIRHGCKGGLDVFGPERRITRSQGSVLYELDGKPALALYKQYLGERAKGLPATGLLFPLSVRTNAGDEKHIVRTVLAVDEKEQSVTFAGDLPQGSLARLMRTNPDLLVEGASQAAEQLSCTSSKAPLTVAVSCVGRRMLLGERTEEELEVVLEELPGGTGLVGFYSYGEIAPYDSGFCDLHNQTMTITTIDEV